MQGLLVVIAPVLLILFALAMQRIEGHLQRLTVQREDVQEFIATHAPVEPFAESTADLMASTAPQAGTTASTSSATR